MEVVFVIFMVISMKNAMLGWAASEGVDKCIYGATLIGRKW